MTPATAPCPHLERLQIRLQGVGILDIKVAELASVEEGSFQSLEDSCCAGCRRGLHNLRERFAHDAAEHIIHACQSAHIGGRSTLDVVHIELFIPHIRHGHKDRGVCKELCERGLGIGQLLHRHTGDCCSQACNASCSPSQCRRVLSSMICSTLCRASICCNKRRA
jgi:hypothetical protein